MIVCLDLETTWLDKNNDKIIEVALIKIDPKTFEIIDTFDTLVNPEILIPELISNITNIFDKDVEESPVIDIELISKIKDFIWDNPIMWHNVYFDTWFLESIWFDFSNNIIIDTFFLSNIFLYNESSLNLWSLCDSLWIELNWAHRALNDVKATIELFREILNKASKLPKYKKELLSFIFSKSEDKSFDYILNLLWDITSIDEENFLKTTKKHLKKYSWVIVENGDNIPNNIDLEAIFQKLPNSEVRQNQLKMSNTVYNSLTDNKKQLIEAPTWVWKTFAYLIPSVYYSIINDKKVFVSTNTKALQDQIYYKDLEFLSKNLGVNFLYSKLKWKKNYLWIFPLINSITNPEYLNSDETSLYSKLLLWSFDSEYWELEELNYYPKEYSYLHDLNADNFLILNEDNPYKEYEFLSKAKKRANNSNIIIINHSILAQELQTKNSTLPKIENLIIDEWHNLEDTLTSSLVKSFSYTNLEELFWNIIKNLKQSWQVVDNLDIKKDSILWNVAFLFDLIEDYKNTKNVYNNDFYDLLLDNDFFTDLENIWKIRETVELNLIDILNELLVLPDKIYLSIKKYITRLEEILEIIKIITDNNSSDKYIRLIKYTKFSWISIWYTHLNIWEYLQQNLWDKCPSVILTSATLDLEDDFTYFKNIYSLNEDFDFLKLESDFDYKKNWLVFVPNDLGSIRYKNPYINDFILELLLKVKWKTLCLFTSFSSIKENYLYSNQKLKDNNISLLTQWIWWSKHKILNSYHKNPSNSVIFGTDSFWEWIDIPWDDLKYLVIHKFPFLVPSDPIFKARSKLFKDSFREYSLKKAILKTKQWFWRLIRTKKDTWVLILLDDRFYNSSWWEEMKKAFPSDIKIKVWSSKSLLDLL